MKKNNLPSRRGFLAVILTLIFSVSSVFTLVSQAFAVTTTPQLLPYQGVLKTPGGSAITTAHDFRFSFWLDADFTAGVDRDGAGAIPGGAPGYSGFSEVQTVTPDSTGFFRMNIGAVAGSIPDFILSSHLYLQVELKPNGSPDTSYETLDVDGIDNALDRQSLGTVPYARNADFLDNAEIGTGAGNIATLGVGGMFAPSLIPGGTDTDFFEIDADDNAVGTINLSFGDSLNNRILSWDANGVGVGNGWFDFSDDLNVTGNLTTTGGITLTGGVVDLSAASQLRLREDTDPATNAACAHVGEIIYDTTDNQLQICTVVGAPGTWTPVDSSHDLDEAYAADSDKILTVDHASGLNVTSSTAGNIVFDLQNTGDFVIKDSGTNFALFSDTGLFELSGLENTERLRLTDSTNTDSVGLYVGTGTPDGVITAESGSSYFDESGSLYVNTSSGGSGSTWNKTSFDKAQVITVAKTGGNFTSLKAALDSITDSSSSKRYSVEIFPGTYDEAPMTIPNYVSILGRGNYENIIIQATDATAVLLFGGHDTVVDNLRFSNASGVGGVCYKSLDESYLLNVEMRNCETGVFVSGPLATVNITGLIADGGNFVDVFKIEAGAVVNISSLSIDTSGTVFRGLNISGSGTKVSMDAVVTSSNSTYGIYINDSAELNIKSAVISNNIYGLWVGPDGTTSVRSSLANLLNNSTWDLYVEGNASRIFLSGLNTTSDKVYINPHSSHVVSYNDNTMSEESLTILGDLKVGSPEYSHRSSFGEGSQYTQGMKVYSSDGLLFTDVSSAAIDPGGATISFPGVTAGNALYFTTTRLNHEGNKIAFGGFEYSTASTALSLGAGQILYEYWNGTSWVNFSVFCYDSELFYRYDSQCFLRSDNTEIVNFNASIVDSWVVNDPVGLGTDYYWIRAQIASDIAIAPVFTQLKILADSTFINSDGSITFVGNARNRRIFVFSPEQIFSGVGANSPGNASYSVGAGVSFSQEYPRSLFSGSGVDLTELTGSVPLPKGICTSCPLTAKVYWKKTDAGAGDVKWLMDYTVGGAQNVEVINGSNIVTAPRSSGEDITAQNGYTISTSPEGDGATVNQIIRSTFSVGSIDISGHYEGDILFVRMYRDAADAADTYSGDVIMTGFEMSGVYWTLGEKL